MNLVSKMSLAFPAHDSSQSVIGQFAWMLGFAGATALGAQVEIPHEPVPYTLQTFVVLLAGGFLGPRNGAGSQVIYLMAGLLGAPVFSGGSFGLGRLLGPTGGYLLAFPIAAVVVGFLLKNHRSLLWSFVAMGGGLFVIFTSGTLQLYVVYFRDWAEAIKGGFLIFSWWDLLKLSAAAMIYHEVSRRKTTDA